MIFEEVCILRNRIRCYKSYFWKATENVSSCQTVQPPHFFWTLTPERYCLKSWSSVHELWRVRGGKVSERINLNKPQRHFREISTFHRAYAEISSLKTNEDVSHYTYSHKSDALFLILMHRSNTRKWDLHCSFPLSGKEAFWPLKDSSLVLSEDTETGVGCSLLWSTNLL